MSGFVQTVLGAVPPDSLGPTMTHEHIRVDYTDIFVEPSKPEHRDKIHLKELQLENLGFVRQFPYSVLNNLKFDEVSLTTIVSELQDYKRLGGGCLVEVTTYSKPKYYEELKKISEESGVHIVCSTACWRGHANDERTIIENMTSDLTLGRDGGIKAGCIGEIKCNSCPMTTREKEILVAAAKVQKDRAAPLMIHPARDTMSPYEIIDVLRLNGADVSKTIIAHLDRTYTERDVLLKFAAYSNCFLEFDLFGIEVSHYQYSDFIDFPSDAQKIQMIKHLIESGYEDRIVIAHDIHTRHRLIQYGGHGYGHILENVIPKMLLRGISKECIDKMILQNPKHWLQMDCLM